MSDGTVWACGHPDESGRILCRFTPGHDDGHSWQVHPPQPGGWWSCETIIKPGQEPVTVFHYYDRDGCYVRTEAIPPDGWEVVPGVIRDSSSR